MDELIGVARGVLADGKFVIEEARFLLDWLKRNEPVRRDYFGKFLYDALGRALADNELSAQEEDALIGVLLQFVGPQPNPNSDDNFSTSLPLDDPPPSVAVDKKSFCLTGKFVFGTRRHCQVAISSWGGLVHQYPIFATDYVVIGDLGSRDWIHSTSGRKIERALEIRTQGHPIKLISEQHWIACMECVDDGDVRISSLPADRCPSVGHCSGEALAGKTIVVTGTLKSYTRDEIQAAIQQHGGRAASSVSKKTDFVLAGEEAGSKLEKAKQLGVLVITEEEFRQMIAK